MSTRRNLLTGAIAAIAALSVGKAAEVDWITTGRFDAKMPSFEKEFVDAPVSRGGMYFKPLELYPQRFD